MKRTIRLTESDLHNIVKESIRRILNEKVDTGQVKAAWERSKNRQKVQELKGLNRK